MNFLPILNTLSNADRHRWFMPDGTDGGGRDRRSDNPLAIHNDRAEVDAPPDAVDVQIVGNPVVAIRFGDKR